MTTQTLEQRKTQFQRMLKKYLLVVDVEATCSEDRAVPRTEMEVIEVGFQVLEKIENRWDEKCEFEFFIKPTLHTVLTPFCKKLTGISQEQVDGGKTYVEALEAMRNVTGWLGDKNDWSWCSWGAYDKNAFLQDAALHGMSPLLGPENHFNLKVWFSSLQGTRKGFGLAKALHYLCMDFQGPHHRALSDAKNTARIFRRMHGDFP